MPDEIILDGWGQVIRGDFRVSSDDHVVRLLGHNFRCPVHNVFLSKLHRGQDFRCPCGRKSTYMCATPECLYSRCSQCLEAQGDENRNVIRGEGAWLEAARDAQALWGGFDDSHSDSESSSSTSSSFPSSSESSSSSEYRLKQHVDFLIYFRRQLRDPTRDYVQVSINEAQGLSSICNNLWDWVPPSYMLGSLFPQLFCDVYLDIPVNVIPVNIFLSKHLCDAFGLANPEQHVPLWMRAFYLPQVYDSTFKKLLFELLFYYRTTTADTRNFVRRAYTDTGSGQIEIDEPEFCLASEREMMSMLSKVEGAYRQVGSMSYFVTLTCNQSSSPGFQALSEVEPDHNLDLALCTQKCILSSELFALMRRWMANDNFPLGRCPLVFGRLEWQSLVRGNLPHLHILCWNGQPREVNIHRVTADMKHLFDWMPEHGFSENDRLSAIFQSSRLLLHTCSPTTRCQRDGRCRGPYNPPRSVAAVCPAPLSFGPLADNILIDIGIFVEERNPSQELLSSASIEYQSPSYVSRMSPTNGEIQFVMQSATNVQVRFCFSLKQATDGSTQEASYMLKYWIKPEDHASIKSKDNPEFLEINLPEANRVPSQKAQETQKAGPIGIGDTEAEYYIMKMAPLSSSGRFTKIPVSSLKQLVVVLGDKKRIWEHEVACAPCCVSGARRVRLDAHQLSLLEELRLSEHNASKIEWFNLRPPLLCEIFRSLHDFYKHCEVSAAPNQQHLDGHNVRVYSVRRLGFRVRDGSSISVKTDSTAEVGASKARIVDARMNGACGSTMT